MGLNRLLCGSRLLALLLVASLLAACGTAPAAQQSATNAGQEPAPAPTTGVVAVGTALPITITNYDGTTTEITDISRIVSLTGDVTEIIFALGMGQNLVGVDTSATYPPAETKALPSIGYQRRLSAEGILALQPTLVIGTENAGPPEVLEQLRTAGVPVALTAAPQVIDAAVQKITFVSQALGVPQRGAALNTQIEADLAADRDALANIGGQKPRVLFMYLRGTDVQQVAGKNTAADAMITAAGGINAAAEAGIDGFKPLSPETVVAAQPDVLLVMTKGLESVGGVDGLLAIQGLADTPAGQNRRVVDLDDLYLLGMGPRTAQALNDLITAFHGEVARR